jgi:hypothetical protein
MRYYHQLNTEMVYIESSKMVYVSKAVVQQVSLYTLDFVPLLYIHTIHALFPKGQQRHIRYSSESPLFY